MHRISASAITFCTLAVLAPIFASADTVPPPVQPKQCTDVIRVQNTDSKTGLSTNAYTTYVKNPETTSQKKLAELKQQCEDGKIYTIIQEPRPKACLDEGEVVQSYRIESRWQDGVNANTKNKPKGRVEFTMISAKGDLGTKVSTDCIPGQSVTDSAQQDEQFAPFARGGTTEGIKKLLDIEKGSKDAEKDYLSHRQYTQELKDTLATNKNLTTAERKQLETELVRATRDEELLNEAAEGKGIIGKGEAVLKNKALDADLAKRLKGYGDPKTWGHYYDQKPETIQQQKTVSAYEDQRRQQETAGFVDPKTAADQQAKIMEYQNAREDYEQCVAETSWYARKIWCLRKEYAAANAISDLEAQGCKVDVSVLGKMGEASCPGSEVTRGSTNVPADTSSTQSENSSITTGNSSPSGFCIISSRPLVAVPANDPRCHGGTIYAPGVIPPPGTKPPPGNNDCTALDARCQAEIDGPLKGNGPYCAELARCQHGNSAPPPPGYQDPRGYGNPPPGNYGNPGGNNPYNQSNPYGYNGLSPQDQQMLERQCFDYGNSNACAALQRYCQNSQSQNQGLGGIGQFLPIITSLIGGGGSNLGNLGGGGLSAQQCANLDTSISNSMCRQYPGTQFTNGRCECPNGGQWDGTRCPAQNSCSQYPGTVLTNGTCQCPSGQQWDGSRCSGAAQEIQAQLACAPSAADIDETSIAISWQCINADTSKGDGFNTNGSTSGSMSVKLKSADLNADATNVDLILTCTKANNTKTAMCPLQINRPFLVAVATYSTVKRGDTATIGWISKGMKDGDDACKITSNKHPDFSQTGRNVVLTTPPIQENTTFTIKCTTKGGVTKTAPVTIDVQ